MAKRWFRIGCATGQLHQEPRNDSESIAGIVIANAYRLEAQAKPGELLIDVATYDALTSEQKENYSNQTFVYLIKSQFGSIKILIKGWLFSNSSQETLLRNA